MGLLLRIRDFLIIAVVTLLLLEIGLRIYNPIWVPLRADQIQLPVNQVVKATNINNKKVDRERVNTYNAIGLRGPNYPERPQDFVKIFTVGGSTTACVTLTDGRTWPELLANSLAANAPPKPLWLNNAGMDGHSTFGHQILLESHLRKYNPEFILFLVGINDMERDDLNDFDTSMLKQGQTLRNQFIAASELLSTAQVLYRTMRAYNHGLNHGIDIDLRSIPAITETPEHVQSELAKHRDKYLDAYKARVKQLIATTRSIGAQPVLITQPALFGTEKDPTTGIEVGPLEYKPGGPSAALMWMSLELYNDVLRDIAAQEKVILIDAARQMPKDSRYYFDWIHYSNEGAVVMAEVVRRGLEPHLF